MCLNHIVTTHATDNTVDTSISLTVKDQENQTGLGSKLNPKFKEQKIVIMICDDRKCEMMMPKHEIATSECLLQHNTLLKVQWSAMQHFINSWVKQTVLSNMLLLKGPGTYGLSR